MLRGTGMRAGRNESQAEMHITATALVHQRIVVTRNVPDFAL